MVNQRWGVNSAGEPINGGVISDNVALDTAGNLVLYANGDYYNGNKRGLGAYADRNGGKRTGGAIQSQQAYGPGSFRIRMKACPRIGTCSAMWLYNNFPSAQGGENHNFEIDIELHGSNVPGSSKNFDTCVFTNWLTESDYASKVVKTAAGNDGNFHEYRFDWHLGSDPRVEYYIDGELLHTSRTCVPTTKMYLWIGVWFPNGWCGEPDFDTDAMIVDRFSYIPFGESVLAPEDYTGDRSAPCDFLQGKVAPFVSNLIIGADSENRWTGGTFEQGAITVVSGETASLTVAEDVWTKTYRMRADVTGDGEITIVQRDCDGTEVARGTFGAAQVSTGCEVRFGAGVSAFEIIVGTSSELKLENFSLNIIPT